MSIADAFVEESLDVCEECDTFNITGLIPEYTLQISAEIILGIESNCSELISAISTLETLATNMILYNPQAFVPDILDGERRNNQEILRQGVQEIVNESKNGPGIAAKMQNEQRYTDRQTEHVQKISNEITNESINDLQIIEKIYRFITSKHYQSHFFEIAEEQGYGIPYLKELSEKEKSALEDLPKGFFKSLRENSELESFLDILSFMIASKDSGKFEKKQIADIVKTVLIIGSGTTKSAIVSSIYCLLKYPEEQERLYQALKNLSLHVYSKEDLRELAELRHNKITSSKFDELLAIDKEQIQNEPAFRQYLEVINIPQDELTEEQFELIKQMKLKSINNTLYVKLMKCPELERFIKEVMRMFPPIAVQARQAKREVQVNDLTVPEGWTVFLANIISNQDERRWENPRDFNPDRFAASSPPRIHPFNYGTNQCMGRFQALSSIKALLYTVLMRYQILPPRDLEGKEINQSFVLSAGVALKFDKPLLARFVKRD